MVVKVRKIGNSLGILLSKSILEQCAIKEDVSIEVLDNTIVIKPVLKQVREGWEEQFLKAGSLNEHEILIDEVSNSFDEEEWTW